MPASEGPKANTKAMQVSKDKVVTIEYRIVDQEGTLVDSSDDSEPLSFLQGSESVFAAIEEQVEGGRMGDRLTFTLEPGQAYGKRDNALRRAIPRSQFLFNGEMQPGMTFSSRREDGQQRMVTVIEVDEKEVTVDANHPLAGVHLNVDLVIVDVREAVEDELATGVVQEMSDIYAREAGSKIDVAPPQKPNIQ